MKLRAALLVVAAFASLVPFSASASHCDSPIYIFSRQRVETDVDDPQNPDQKVARTVPSAVSSAVGCTVIRDIVIAEEPPSEAHAITDTDVIYPNANYLEVRLLDNGSDPDLVASAVLTFAGETYELTMDKSVSVTGEAADWLDSQSIAIDPADTLEANTATATICLTDGVCYERTYRTVFVV